MEVIKHADLDKRERLRKGLDDVHWRQGSSLHTTQCNEPCSMAVYKHIGMPPKLHLA